jgi:hypothetical protein
MEQIMHTTSTATTATSRSPARRLGAILFGLVLAGSAAFGVQTLLAAPVVNCEDPILTCSLGGDDRCLQCCQLSGDLGGACIGNNGMVCICFQ